MVDQKRFASLSGDFNPLHLDPGVARRTMFGEPVVHGMHCVAWALERYLAQLRKRGVKDFCVSTVSATFAKPVYLGERIRADELKSPTGSARIQVASRGVVLVDITLRGTPTASPRHWPSRIAGRRSTMPKDPSIEQLPGCSGVVDLYYDARSLRRDFPVSCALVGTGVVARLISLSRLVGMECPGLNSLFASFELEFLADHGTGGLDFRVTRVDPRFSGVQIKLGGAGMAGSIKAFLRPAPNKQASMEAIAATVSRGHFTGQRALVVGGSRGLGEVVAKLIAGGGGHPVITYLHGHGDARRVAEEIERWGGTCGVVQLNVASPRRPLLGLARNGWSPTHLYYFATPRIFVRRQGIFDEHVFRGFAAVYLTGFSRTYEACRLVAREPLRIFYPSSVAVDENLRELTEYAAAKAAGELLCRQLQRSGSDTRVLIERLPRIGTDQTATLVKIPAADAVEVMHGIVERMRGL